MEILDYGVCRLSVVAVRAAANDKSEQATQLLFGDHYEVIGKSTNNKWINIRINFDQYEGWIDSLQHHAVSQEYYRYLDRAEFKITTDVTSSLLYHKNPLAILMGSMIPISSSELFKMEEQFAFNGEAKNLGQKREYEYLRNIAFKYLNAPYLWGGKHPFGIDCSGFVQMVFKICGYRLPRDADQQAGYGKALAGMHEVKPKDLIFFQSKDGRVNHVGIALEENKIIHASGKVRVDLLAEHGIVNLDTQLSARKFSHAKRVLSD
jgi:hypothetical protein